jgi:hypothetical protein
LFHFRHCVDCTVISAGQNIESCAVTAIGPVVYTFEDLLSIGGNAATLLVDTQKKMATGSIFDIAGIAATAATAMSKGLLLVSSLTSDLVSLSTQLPNIALQIPICGTVEATKAATQFQTILTNVQSCIRN